MLPDFPDLKSKYRKWSDEALRRFHQLEAPVIATLKKIRLHEGTILAREEEDNIIVETELREISSGGEIDTSDIPQMGPERILELTLGAASDLAKQQEEPLLKQLTQLAKKSGKVVKIKGTLFNQETYLQALEEIDLDFNYKTGKPIIPTMLYAPDPNVLKKIQEMHQDESFNAKCQEIIEKKRIAWRDRESNRQLVD